MWKRLIFPQAEYEKDYFLFLIQLIVQGIYVSYKHFRTICSKLLDVEQNVPYNNIINLLFGVEMKRILSILFCVFFISLCGCKKNVTSNNESDLISASTTSENFSISIPTVTYTPVESIVVYCGDDIFDCTEYYLELEVNDIIEFSASVQPSNATNQHILWSSSSNSVIVANGLICAVNSGFAMITLTAADNVIESFKVVVVEPEIELTKNNYLNYLNINYSLTNSSADVYVYLKQPLYQISSLNIAINIGFKLIYSRRGYLDVTTYQSISFFVGDSLNASYSLYYLIMQNTPSYYSLKDIVYDTPVVTSVSGTMKKIL